MDDRNPFSYSPFTYLWVFAVSALAGAVRYLNGAPRDELSWIRFCIELITSMFTGLLTFWLCEHTGIQGPMSAILIAVSGLMGSRAWTEFENLWKLKMLAANVRLEDIERASTDAKGDSNDTTKS